jgi:hypothetical protein
MKVFDGSDHNGQGDGVLFYPGADGPLSSIRLENIADGLEDAELFRRYAAALKQQGQFPGSGDLVPRVWRCSVG